MITRFRPGARFRGSSTVSGSGDRTVALLARLALGVAAVGSVKFLSILAAGEFPPVGFAAVFVLPFLLAPRLLRRRPRLGAVVAGVPAAALAVLCVLALSRPSPYLGDRLVVYVGGPLALATAVLAVRVGLTGSAGRTGRGRVAEGAHSPA